MIIPVRCYTCGKVIGHLYEEYQRREAMGENRKEILDSLGLKYYCCRRMFLAHADLIDEVMEYN